MRADVFAKSLGASRYGNTWMARCPAHEDRVPSLAIRQAGDGRTLVFCHAGCSQDQVLKALKVSGLNDRGRRQTFPTASPPVSANNLSARREAALRLWESAAPGNGSRVDTYLASRRLRLSSPSSLRFHPGLRHPKGCAFPAMVALVTTGPDDRAVAVHRTWLKADGSGKAPIDPVRAMLGPCRGGAVRLAVPDKILMVGEGIETCLAAMQATGYAAWAALSVSGLRSLILPHDVRDVIILADGDAPGEAAARVTADRWLREGRRVRIASPPHGLDFNDLLLGLSDKAGSSADDQ